jgi:hypothetical protein
MLEKVRELIAMQSSHDLFLLFGVILVYHLLLFLVMYFLFASPAKARLRAMEAAMTRQTKKHEESWKDREAEVRMIMLNEKEREILQIKAEYDSYVKLLEQKLLRSRTKEAS